MKVETVIIVLIFFFAFWSLTSLSPRTHHQQQVKKDSSPDQYSSWFTCTDVNEDSQFSDRSCTYYNFCVVPDGGIVPRFDLDEKRSTGNTSIAQLSTYIHEGAEVWFQPQLKERAILNGFVTEHTAAIIYAPAAWPCKLVVHWLGNHILPLFRQLVNAEPQRSFEFPALQQVWRYNVDLIMTGHGFNGAGRQCGRKSWYEFLGVNRIMTASGAWDKRTRMLTPDKFVDMQETTGVQMLRTEPARCYSRLHAGVGGSRGHYQTEGYKNPRLNVISPRVYRGLREAFLNQGSGCNVAKHPPQDSLEIPHVVLAQRDAATESGKMGDRTFHNIGNLTNVLEQMKTAQKITYSVTVFNANMMLLEQACVVYGASILIGIHGNQLGWALLMVPGTVLVEFPKGKLRAFYGSLARAAGLRYIHAFPKPSSNAPSAFDFETHVNRAIDIWKHSFGKM